MNPSTSRFALRQQVVPCTLFGNLSLVLSICAVALDRLVNRIEQHLVAKRFSQKLNRTGLHRLHRHRDVTMAGDEDNRNRKISRSQFALEIEAAQSRQTAALTHWGSVTPFVLKSSAQFRCAEPPAVNRSRALADIEGVRAIGGSKSVTRTAEQSEIGRSWYENSPRGWNRIAREVAAARQFDVWENARLFALVNLAMADGYIGGFETKYYYNYWRMCCNFAVEPKVGVDDRKFSSSQRTDRE